MARPALSARRTVVLVHGTLCSGRMWAPVAAAMGDGYDVRMPDLVGAGNAPAWHGERPFRLSDDARRVTAAITDVNGTFDLVGHSYGGAVALKLAMEIPGRVRNLVLIEPSWFTFLSGLGPKAAAARSEIGDIATTVAQTLVTGKAIRHESPRPVSRDAGRGATRLFRRLSEPVRTAPDSP
jgi:pimeloyl-ACP methyl ester carboxylesterase